MCPEEFTSLKDGIEHSFFLSYNMEFNKDFKFYFYNFQIWQQGIEPTSIFVKIMPNNADLKLIDLYPSEPYKKKGMSIAFILKIKSLLDKRIISSSRRHKTFSGEDRRDDATKYVWEPMIEKGLAKYNSELDYFYTL